jgi:hypothetical protein
MSEQLTDDHDDEREHSTLEHGSLYWDTHRWKAYSPYREDDDFVYMVTVRRKSEIEDGLEAGSFLPHEDRLADSPFEDLDAISSFRARAADEAALLADLLADGDDEE